MSGTQKKIQDHGLEWAWVVSTVERGHWTGTDNTGIKIFPPSEGVTKWIVRVRQMNGPGEMESEFNDGRPAFDCAADIRLGRAN